MKNLNQILENVPAAIMSGSDSVAVPALSIDSRHVQEGAAYFALKGTHTDGHQYIQDAIDSGAKVIFCEEVPQTFTDGITYVQSTDNALTLGLVASAFYNHPSRNMKVVGVTGTNGKTTIATLAYKLLTQLGYQCGLISTVQNRIGEKVSDSTHTTPDAIRIQSLMAEMEESGCDYV